jgi:hypothetical protein
MRAFVKILVLFTSALLVSTARGAVITLSYTEYFDYNIAGIVGHPSATWSATFNASLAPGNPFPSQPLSVNQDFVLSALATTGAPSLIWQAGNISGAGPASFTLGGTSYLVFPFLPLFPSCSLPCSEVASHPNQAANFANPAVSFFATTPDNYVGVAAVPEPSSELALGLALIVLAMGLKTRNFAGARGQALFVYRLHEGSRPITSARIE